MKIWAKVAKNCYYQAAVARLRDTKSVKTNSKVTDNAIMQRSFDFGKTP